MSTKFLCDYFVHDEQGKESIGCTVDFYILFYFVFWILNFGKLSSGPIISSIKN